MEVDCFIKLSFGAAHGLKSWGAVKSEDLVHFTETESKFGSDTLIRLATVPAPVPPHEV